MANKKRWFSYKVYSNICLIYSRGIDDQPESTSFNRGHVLVYYNKSENTSI